MSNYSDFIELTPSTPIKDALRLFQKDLKGILLVCEPIAKLRGVITDGDLRKAVARGLDIEATCETIMNKNPSTLSHDLSDQEIREVIHHEKYGSIFYFPVLDNNGLITRVIERENLKSSQNLPLRSVIMAGGFGSRLKELTKHVPKPMLKINDDKSLLEHIVEQMVQNGIQDIIISTHHLANQIYDYFGNGHKFGANISYVHEENPIGTAGALSLIEDTSTPFLVMNGDILTTLDFKMMWERHVASGSDLTVACRQYDMSIPYGVVETDDQDNIIALKEKPKHSFRVNAGIYIIQPEIVKSIPYNQYMNMTDVITQCYKNNLKVKSFVMHEYWLDVGVPKDFKKAQEDYEELFINKRVKG